MANSMPGLLRYPGIHTLLGIPGGIQIPTPANLAKLLNPASFQQGIVTMVTIIVTIVTLDKTPGNDRIEVFSTEPNF